MSPEQFIEDARVVHTLNDLKHELKESGQKLIVSDVLDDDGNQYVNLVQEGGGMLGIALIGYIYVLEELGIRFLNLAGTSAGAISSLLLGSIGRPNDKKALTLVDILANKDFYDFVDGGKDSRRFIKTLTNKGGKIMLFLNGLRILDNLKKDLGLNPGDSFSKWLEEILAENGVLTTKDLLTKLNNTPNLRLRKGITGSLDADEVKIALIATDVTTETKVVFPDMGKLYYDEYLDVNPSEYVRASMSVPFFFAPHKISNIPKGKEQLEEWESKTKFRGSIPDEVLMVDGGILSNFPIDTFYNDEIVPQLPTFGVKLGVDRSKMNKTKTVLDLLFSSFNASRKIRDFEFIFNNKNFDKSVCVIDIQDAENKWINFNLSEKEKIELFVDGVKGACQFIRAFDWNRYKKIRVDYLNQKVVDIVKPLDVSEIDPKTSIKIISKELSTNIDQPLYLFVPLEVEESFFLNEIFYTSASCILLSTFLEGILKTLNGTFKSWGKKVGGLIGEKLERLFHKNGEQQSHEDIENEISKKVQEIQNKISEQSIENPKELTIDIHMELKSEFINRGLIDDSVDRILDCIKNECIKLLAQKS